VRVAQFTGSHLLNSQTDGSSFPNGGLRFTHTAAAFITVDPESCAPLFNFLVVFDSFCTDPQYHRAGINRFRLIN
jgi:glutamine synthetase type III